MLENNQIQCPNCGHPIDVNEILSHKLEDEFQKKYNEKYSELKSEKEKIEKLKEEVNDSIEQGVSARLSKEKSKLEKNIRQQIHEEKSEQIKSYQEQLNQKVAEVKELNKTKAELAKTKREKDEMQEKIEAESELKLTERLQDEKKKIRAEVEAKTQLKLSERELLIQQLTEQLKESQRKIEQGSMQSQGEAQELIIEEFLRTNFPLDLIEEIKKGVKGADCLQIVNTRTSQSCGTILYESKRTKDFQPAWIEKFKKDVREKSASFGVLVTDSYPSGMERFGQKSGVWICSYEEFKGLSFVLREMIIQINEANLAQENKGGKMEMLYGYLTGNEFRGQVEAIVEGFSQMHSDLAKEKRALEAIWKQREKQIQKVLLNTTHLYSSVKGIAGNAIGSIKELELPSPTETKKISHK